LAGKAAVFDVTVLEASKRTVPELSDEFAAKVKAGLTAESLQAELRKAVDAEDAKGFVGARNAALSKALADTLEVDIPDTLVTNQAREKFALMMTEMRDNGVSDEEIKNQIKPENFLKYKSIVKDDIVRDFRVSMATDEIARMEGITVPDYQIEEQMESIRKDAAAEGDEIDENLIRGKVAATLQRQAVFDFLAEHAELEVIYEEEKFDEELMAKLAEESLQRMEKMKEQVPQDVEVVE
jgi:trigger factor